MKSPLGWRHKHGSYLLVSGNMQHRAVPHTFTAALQDIKLMGLDKRGTHLTHWHGPFIPGDGLSLPKNMRSYCWCSSAPQPCQYSAHQWE